MSIFIIPDPQNFIKAMDKDLVVIPLSTDAFSASSVYKNLSNYEAHKAK